MGFEDVIRITGYVTTREDFPAYMGVRDRFISDPMPVSTLLIVSGFTRAEFLVEVEVTAAKLP
nr:Rid family hydrolase [Marinicella sp. W31]MDC2879779.1 Rid family hydrolase [Marinicella sp. W31]